MYIYIHTYKRKKIDGVRHCKNLRCELIQARERERERARESERERKREKERQRAREKERERERETSAVSTAASRSRRAALILFIAANTVASGCDEGLGFRLGLVSGDLVHCCQHCCVGL